MASSVFFAFPLRGRWQSPHHGRRLPDEEEAQIISIGETARLRPALPLFSSRRLQAAGKGVKYSYHRSSSEPIGKG